MNFMLGAGRGRWGGRESGTEGVSVGWMKKGESEGEGEGEASEKTVGGRMGLKKRERRCGTALILGYVVDLGRYNNERLDR